MIVGIADVKGLSDDSIAISSANTSVLRLGDRAAIESQCDDAAANRRQRIYSFRGCLFAGLVAFLERTQPHDGSRAIS